MGSIRVVVVFESFFGNTRALAEAIARGMGVADPEAVVTVHSVGEAPGLDDVDLVVVGAPTHALGLSSWASRWLHAQYWGDPVAPRRAQRPHGRPSTNASVRGWLGSLLMTRTSVHAAAFDTRVRGRPVGGAGAGIARRLQACGFLLLAEPEPFLVEGVTGPLREGELQRATLWGRSLVLRMR